MTALALGGAVGSGPAEALAKWAHGLQPDGDDLALAGRSLADTVAVALAAAQLRAKIGDCVAGLDTDPASWTWDNAAQVLESPWRD